MVDLSLTEKEFDQILDGLKVKHIHRSTMRSKRKEIKSFYATSVGIDYITTTIMHHNRQG